MTLVDAVKVSPIIVLFLKSSVATGFARNISQGPDITLELSKKSFSSSKLDWHLEGW